MDANSRDLGGSSRYDVDGMPTGGKKLRPADDVAVLRVAENANLHGLLRVMVGGLHAIRERDWAARTGQGTPPTAHSYAAERHVIAVALLSVLTFSENPLEFFIIDLFSVL